MEAINENESVALNEILLNILENNFNLFFESIVKFDVEMREIEDISINIFIDILIQ